MKNYYFLIALLFTGLANAQFQIDFDNMNPGAVSPQSSHIVLWPAAVTDAQVTTEQASSTPHSIVIREQAGGNIDDILVNLGNKTSGIWSVSWKMYVPTGKTGYWNIQQNENANPSQWNGEYHVGLTGSGGSAGVITHSVTSATVAYPENTWFDVVIVVDLDLGKINVTINGAVLLNNANYHDTNGVAATQLGAINFYAVDLNNRYFIDDFILVETCVDPVIIQTTVPDNICEGETAQLVTASNGDTALWYDQATGGNLLHTGFVYVTGPLTQTTSFWVEAQNETGAGDICSSAREEVIVNVTPTPDPPLGDPIQYFSPGETLAFLNVTGMNLRWFSDMNGNVEIPDTTPLVDGATYYVNQSDEGCEGSLLGITVFMNLSVEHHKLPGLDFYPNPAVDNIHLVSAYRIDLVEIYSLTGQKVLKVDWNISSSVLNISDLKTGVYFVKISGEKGTGMYRLIKQ